MKRRRAIPNRLLFRDPRPLPPGSPPYVDEDVAAEAERQQEISARLMRQYDKLPTIVRHVEWAVGNIGVARDLVARGITSPKEAEPVVRDMLSARQQGRR